MEKCLIMLLSLGAALPSSSQSLLDDAASEGLESALTEMQMSPRDLAFHKDVGEPEVYFQWSRDWLHDPLQFPTRAGELSAGLSGGGEVSFAFIARMMEAEALPALEDPTDPTDLSELSDLILRNALSAFLEQAHTANALLARAFADVAENERRYLAMSLFAGAMNAEDRPEIQDAILALPVPNQEFESMMAERDVLDPAPYVQREVDNLKAVNRACLVEAARIWVGALRRLQEQVLKVKGWPADGLRIDSDLGSIVVGTEADDTYRIASLLILDPGGDDVYVAPCGVANGLAKRPLAGIIDLAGRDVYRSDNLLGPGTGLFGLSALFDLEGNDRYDIRYVGGGVGLFGAGWVEDSGGDDHYKAEGLGQAVGHVGVGVLDDKAGSDTYELGYSGQGYAGVLGVGLLVDRAGNDRYLAGGVRPDYERHDDRYLTLAQGFSIGSRPHAGGGFAALIDQAGNDSYVADIYGQGVGYWYAAGMLLDASGNDTYQLHQYGQGSGIHLSLGLLADHQGNDTYTGCVLTQGSAHDYGVGFLLEGGGDDTYTADHHSQGRALNNALAILIDAAGNDAYFSRQCDQSQGIGNDGDTREYGSLALLVDLAGEDQYNCGGADGQSVLRPDFGIIYDRGEVGE